jgi:hypothetical protein
VQILESINIAVVEMLDSMTGCDGSAERRVVRNAATNRFGAY